MVIMFQVAYGSPHYGGQRVGGSPQAAASPHLSSSPQVPSPQGQTLDLSVSRLSHRLVHHLLIKTQTVRVLHGTCTHLINNIGLKKESTW